MSRETERHDHAAAYLRRPGQSTKFTLARPYRVAGAAFLGVVVLLGLLVGAFFLRLAYGPLALSWLAPEIVASLHELSGGAYNFQLAGASVANTANGPTVTVDGLVVKNGARAIFAAPRAELSVDLPSLLIGRVKPRRLVALGLQLRLSVHPDGTVAVSAGAEPVTATKIAPAPTTAPPISVPGAAPQRVELLRAAAGALRELMDLATSPASPIGRLDRVAVSGGTLVFDDRTMDRVVTYRDLTLSLEKGDGEMLFSAGATGPSRRWTAGAAAKGAPGARRDFLAEVHDLTIDEISLIGGFRRTGADTDAPLSGSLSFALGPDNRVLQAVGRVDVGKGFFRLDEPDHEPVMIDDINLTAGWDPAAHKILLSPITFKAGGFDLAFTGEAIPPPETADAAAPETDAWKIDVHLEKPTLVSPERVFEEPVKVNEAIFQGRLLNTLGKFVVDRFTLEGPHLHAGLTASAQFRDDVRVAYELVTHDTAIAKLARLWPTHVAPPVRAWFVEHISKGFLKTAKCAGEFDDAALVAMRYERPPPDDAVRVDGEVVDATVVDVVPGMPSITDVSGTLHVTGRTATFLAQSAILESAPGRRLTLKDARFAIPDNAIRPTPAQLDIDVSGNVEAVADVLNVPAIAKYASIPVQAENIKGQLAGRLHLDFEVGFDARDDQTKFTIDATTNNLVVEKLIGKERLDNGTLHVLASPDGLHVTGNGRIFGAPSTLDLHRAFGEKGAAQAQMTLTFDDAARQRAGYAIAGISGPINAIVRTPLPIDDVNTQIELDLTRTTIDHPIPGLTKAAGKPGKASFLFGKRGDAIILDQFNFEAGPAQAIGSIDLTREGWFRAAKFSSIRLSPGDDMHVDIARNGDVAKVVARAANFDARPLLLSLVRVNGERAGAGGGKGYANNGVGIDDVDIDFKSPIVTGHNKQILSNVDLKMERRSSKLRTLAVNGFFGREQLAIVMARNQNNAQQVEVASNDAGSFLSFLDVYRKMDAGILNASVQLGPNRAEGGLRIHDFFVKGEPTMRQLMAQSGVSRTDDRGVTRFDPDLVRVGQLQTKFAWTNGNLAVNEGVMSGPEIGMTFDGFVDFPRDRVDLSGTYIPAYALNSLLSNIPVLGVVITGGEHEGIFALNFRVTGQLSAPTVNVNPLSAIAPGLMRKIMGVLDGTVRPPPGQ